MPKTEVQQVHKLSPPLALNMMTNDSHGLNLSEKAYKTSLRPRKIYPSAMFIFHAHRCRHLTLFLLPVQLFFFLSKLLFVTLFAGVVVVVIVIVDALVVVTDNYC